MSARRRRLGRLAATVLAAVAAPLASSASPALAAGSLTVHLGAMPDGTAVPTGPWAGLNTNGASGFGVTVPIGAPQGWSRTATLVVPAGVAVASAMADRWFETPVSSDTAQANVTTSWEARGYPHTGCISSPWGCGYLGDSGSGPVTVTAPTGPLTITATCMAFGAGGGTCHPGSTWLARRIELRLTDATAPGATLRGGGGALLSGAWQTAAAASATLTAGDTGSGAYRAFFRTAAGTHYVPLDPADARCRDARPAAGDSYEFAAGTGSVVPCPTASADYAPEFDLAALGDGAHVGDLGVEDASGRETIVAPGVSLRVNAPGGALRDPGEPCMNGAYDVAGVCIARPPSVTLLPALSGDAGIGGTLTTTAGTWADATGATITYGWERCDASGSSCQAIAGATGAALTVGAEMAGERIRSVVTVTASGGTTRARSPLSPIVQAAAGTGSGGAGGVRDVEPSPGDGSNARGAERRPRDLFSFETAGLDLPIPSSAADHQSDAMNGSGGDGTPARIVARLRGLRSARSFGALAEVIGRLTTRSGTPIRDAQVDIIVHAAREGALGSIAGAVHTDDAGRFRFAAPPGASRIYSFGYREHLSDTVYVDVAHVTIAVHPAVTLRSDKRRVQVTAGSPVAHTRGAPLGRDKAWATATRRRLAQAAHQAGDRSVVTLSGTVTGPPEATRSGWALLQVHHGRRWSTFASVRIRDGRFHHRQRFTRTRRTTTYLIRAAVPFNPRHALEASHSEPIRITATPGARPTPTKDHR